MILTIDNLDGRGAVDYTQAMDFSTPFEVERTLNQPSLLRGALILAGSSLPVPVRRGRVTLTAAAGTTLFTGYLTVEPVALYLGEASAGPVYTSVLSAVSDEWLLDQQSFLNRYGSGLGLGEYTQTLLSTLASRIAPSSVFASVSAPISRAVGYLSQENHRAWSATAGALASASAFAYRALNGSVTLTPVAGTTHIFSDGDGSLAIAALQTTSVRTLANDVTVTGADEPWAYFTELFTGDGSTAVFPLLGEPETPNAGHAELLADVFDQQAFNTELWQITDPGSHFGMGAGGLTLTGGNGLDGQTVFAAFNPIELGGTLIFELGSVLLQPGSAGILGGLYAGAPILANCTGGFSVAPSGGNTVLTPIVNGTAAGTPLTLVAGAPYTLRLRLHCPEPIRVQQSYYAMVDTLGAPGAQPQIFGGGLVTAPLALVFEARNLEASSNTPATVLFDGMLASSPARATPVVANSLSLSGSIAAVSVAATGSGWVRSTSASGTQWTRLIGKAAEGDDCALSASVSGQVSFFAGRIPAAGETVTVAYRGRRRAVARLADPESLATEAAGSVAGSGASGTARWIGHVVTPPARCQEDCEAAAQAILSFATERAAAISGSYTALNPVSGGDIWPGDVLSLVNCEATTNVIVRKVSLSSRGAYPEILTYRLAFANEWAEGLALTLSETVPADALLPALPLLLADSTTGSPTLPGRTLASLQSITVLGPAGNALTVDAGQAAPNGGGFEVRRSDSGWGVGSAGTASGNLVLRSPVRGFSLPVSAVHESFYIRMYDASTPPLYSRRSAAIVTHLANAAG